MELQDVLRQYEDGLISFAEMLAVFVQFQLESETRQADRRWAQREK